MKKESVSNKVKRNYEEIKLEITNLVHLTQAISIVVTSGLAFYFSYTHEFATTWFGWGGMFCSGIVAIMGGEALRKELKKRGE